MLVTNVPDVLSVRSSTVNLRHVTPQKNEEPNCIAAKAWNHVTEIRYHLFQSKNKIPRTSGKKYASLKETRSFFTVFMKTRNCILFWAGYIQNTISHLLIYNLLLYLVRLKELRTVNLKVKVSCKVPSHTLMGSYKGHNEEDIFSLIWTFHLRLGFGNDFRFRII
jgi:hypothetical protein